METNTSRMINLNGSNYQLWKTRTKDFLYVNGFHQPMICSEKPVDKTNEEWNLLHHRVCGFIRHWVDDSVLCHVSEETNAHSLWSKLEQLYAPKTSNSTAGDVISVELDENNVLNEETRRTPQNCELVNKKRTFSASQVETVKHHYPNGPSSLTYGNNRKVRFCTLENPKKIEFSLELSSLNNYDDVVERVASHLNLDDPSKIRLTPHKRYKTLSKPQPIRHRGFKHLSDILPYKKVILTFLHSKTKHAFFFRL
ncbi:uncharacterized protein LOC143630155 isoform X5 [Bidens hawaiensis]|uniref:uncharacterized protein LOC143630155 isoform X5 n=1 Tax=Bidens hawaiensis TaxID=980011 RepID=UPI00404AEC6A